MGKIIDIVGERFGRLIVLSPAPRSKDNKTMWLCKCDCGKQKEVIGGNLKNGTTKSCGCYCLDIRKTNRFKPIRSICEICGNVFLNRRSHQLKTCSPKCHRERVTKKQKVYLYSNIEQYLNKLIHGRRFIAKKRGMEFSITRDYLLKLYHDQNGKCRATGQILKIPTEVDSKTPWTVSIDRIDNNKGYIKGNVQLVSQIYNLCKNIWSEDDVLEFCKCVLDNRNKRL
jgi:hypothetical protein